MLLNSSDKDHADAMVFYAPDIRELGRIDNTRSDTETSYLLNIINGFTHTTSIGIETGMGYEMNDSVKKSDLIIDFSVSFTDGQSASVAKVVEFKIPARKEAFFIR